MGALGNDQSEVAVITCDCDPDRPDFGGASYACRDRLTWQGVEEGIPALVGELETAPTSAARATRAGTG